MLEKFTKTVKKAALTKPEQAYSSGNSRHSVFCENLN